MTNRLLIIFVRNPVLGKVKTRLAATLGNKRALEIYKNLLTHTVDITKDLKTTKVVFYSDQVEANDIWSGEVYQKRAQHGNDLGERMEAAFKWGFEAGYNQICIIGSDCAELTSSIIMHGFEALNSNDSVIGPSTDGGYYLLGMREMFSDVFHNKQWGTDSVASDTIADFNSLQLSFIKLVPLNDIDVEADLDLQDKEFKE